MQILILTEKEIRNCTCMDQTSLASIENAFVSLSRGEASLPPVLHLEIPENLGEVHIKTAYIKGYSNFAIKIASGFFENRKLGLPTGAGLMVVVSAETGFTQALLLDNGYLTDVRTGLAGAIAAKYLAPQKIHTAGVIGAGAQARYQIRALSLVRKFERLLVYSLLPDEVAHYAQEISAELGVEVIPCKDAEKVVRQSDLVVTTTPARQPYLRPEWLHPGLHITCMGSDSKEKQELFAEVFQQADRIACDHRDQCFHFGELHHAFQAGIVTAHRQVSELGELIQSPQAGRQSEREITICDLTGVGVQDTAIALLTLQLAQENRSGLYVGI